MEHLTIGADRIDVHTHLVPPFWARDLPLHGGNPSGWGAPDWSPDQLITFMDGERIAVSMLSLTAPGIESWKGADRIAIARQVNDYGAELVTHHPDRLGYLATLALPDVDAGLAEIRRCCDELGVDGVRLHRGHAIEGATGLDFAHVTGSGGQDRGQA